VAFSARRALVLGGSLALCPSEIPLTEGAIEASLPLAFGVVPVAIALGRWYWAHVSCRFFPIIEGDLYRSGALRPRRLERLVRRRGIRAVVDLRSPRSAVDSERAMLAGIGVAHYNVPSKQRPRADTVEAVLALVDRPENRPLLIHCQHGVRRAAQFEAIFRMEYEGWSNQRALHVLRRRSAFTSFRPRSRGAEFLRSYVPRRARDRVHTSGGAAETFGAITEPCSLGP